MRLLALCVVLGLAAPAAAQVDCDALRSEASRLHEAERYREAAAAYVTIAREHRECGYLDQVLYNAAVDYEAARLVGRAIQVRNVLITNFPDSPLASRAVYLIAGNYHSLAIYENAATWYERFARDYPGATLPLRQLVDESGALRDVCVDEEQADPGRCAVARWALENVVFFRRSLGDADGASAAAALYVAAYRTTFPEDTASVVFSTRPEVRDDEPIEDPAAVEAFLAAFLADYGSVLRLDQETRARVDLARAQLALDRRPDAERELDRVIALVTPEAVSALFATGDAGVLYGARARDAAGEAVVLRADLDELELPGVPAVTGRHTEAGIRAWATGAFARWVASATEAIVARTAAYEAAADGTVPNWNVAAAERVGRMYFRAARAGRAFVMPAWADADDRLALALEDAVEEALRPLVDAATARWSYCAILAERVRWFSYEAEVCVAGLDFLDRSRPEHVEIHGVPDHVFDDLAPPGPVFELPDPESAAPSEPTEGAVPAE